jgi:metal-responsive CopG/Arc/MetJ family transcriptional regulator
MSDQSLNSILLEHNTWKHWLKVTISWGITVLEWWKESGHNTELFKLDSEFSPNYIIKLQSVLEHDECISLISRQGNIKHNQANSITSHKARKYSFVVTIISLCTAPTSTKCVLNQFAATRIHCIFKVLTSSFSMQYKRYRACFWH